MFSLCFGKIFKIPVFSLTGNIVGHFPCFPCAVGTLLQDGRSADKRRYNHIQDFKKKIKKKRGGGDALMGDSLNSVFSAEFYIKKLNLGQKGRGARRHAPSKSANVGYKTCPIL